LALVRSVRVIASGLVGRGLHTAEWDGKTEAGMSVPAGVYFVRLSTGQGRLAEPMIVLR
jgi:flagellar hook assembly protein FlgD